MKKILYVFVMSIVMCLLVGCVNPFIKNPHDYPNSVWISESPYFKMKVNGEGQSKNILMINGELKEVIMLFKASKSKCYPVEGAYIDDNKYFLAECECSKKKCVFKIIKKKEGILEGVDEIVLVNQAYKEK